MTVSANPRSARREPACHELVCSCRALAEPNHSGRYRQVRKPQWLGSRTTRAKRGPRLRRLFKQEPIYEQSAMRTLREQWQKWPSKRARQQLKIEQLRLRRPGVRHEPALANPPERVFSRRWPDDENSMTIISSDLRRSPELMRTTRAHCGSGPRWSSAIRSPWRFWQSRSGGEPAGKSGGATAGKRKPRV